MNFNFFTNFFARIDGAVMSYIDAMAGNVNSFIVPIVSGCLGIAITWMTAKALIGVSEDPTDEFLMKILWMAAVGAVAGAGGLYQTNIAEMVMKLPETVSLGLIGVGTADANLLDKMAELGIDKASVAIEKFIDSPLSGFLWLIAGAIYIGVTGLMVVIGGGFIMIAKVMVGILAALGPIFIYALLFNSSRTFFANWLNQIVYYSAMTVIFGVVYGFFMNMFELYTTQVNFDDEGSNLIYTTMGAVFIGVMAFRANREIPRLAASLSNGFHIASIVGQAHDKGKGDKEKPKK